MKVHFYRLGSSEPVAIVELEVVPRGIYTIDDVDYLVDEQPQFVIKDGKLEFARLIAKRVEDYRDLES